MLTQLNREFPTVSLLDIGAILRQVGQVLSQVSRALEVMVGLVTACGVLLLLAQRKTVGSIERELFIANGTAKTHIRHIYRKLDIHSRDELSDLLGLFE